MGKAVVLVLAPVALVGLLVAAWRDLHPGTDAFETQAEQESLVEHMQTARSQSNPPAQGGVDQVPLVAPRDRMLAPALENPEEPTHATRLLLEARLRENELFDPSRITSVSPTYTAESAAAASYLNPRNKLLSAEQRARLQQLLDQQNAEENSLHRADFEARGQAFSRAIQRGSVRELPDENPVPGMKFDRDSIAEHQERVLAGRASARLEMEAAMGQEYRDWMSLSLGVAGQGGALHHYLVYYTRADEPEAFAAWDRVNARAAACRQQLKDFFASLP